MKKGTIAGFRGKYRWLSNFERCEILYKGIIYQSTESAYQAQKTLKISVRHIFAKLDSRESKALAKALTIRGDWDEIKYDIMSDICRVKFNMPQFKPRLIDTGEMEIIESNHWGDTYWGECDGEGENHLGHIIMDIRDELREQSRSK